MSRFDKLEGGIETESKEFRRTVVDVSCLVDKGLRPIYQAGCGGFGCTYIVCKLEKCDYIAKIGEISDKEVELISLFSGTLHPLFYDYFECPAINSLPSLMAKVGVVIMDKLDMTLTDMIPDLNKRSLKLLKNLAIEAIKNRFYHGDLHGSNIMAKLDDDIDIIDWKLIDFGHAAIIPDNKPLDPIIAEWVNLLGLIVRDLEEDNGDPHLIDMIQKMDLEQELMNIAGISSYNHTSKYMLN